MFFELIYNKCLILEKITYEKVLTQRTKDDNIIKDEAKKVSKIDDEKNFKKFSKKVLTFFDKRGNII